MPGATYFFTVNLQNRRSNLLTTQIEHLRTAIRTTRARNPFHIDAWVALPDHMHCLWTLPPNDRNFPARWQMLKAAFSHAVHHPENPRPSLIRKRERGLWQRRYWEHTIRDEQDYAAHMDYIRFNPVKHCLANHPADWPLSTFAKCVKLDLYPLDWANPTKPNLQTGEPSDQSQTPHPSKSPIKPAPSPCNITQTP